MSTVLPESADPEIHAERAYLHAARAALRARRSDVITTGAVQDSAEDADYTFTNRLLRLDRERYADALADLPDVPLFFGRMDYPPGAVFEQYMAQTHTAEGRPTDADEDRVYIGRRHVRAPDSTPLVIDWRAPISSAFYRATPAEPHGALRRRRYGFDGGELTAYEDEPLQGGATGEGSEMLAADIERPRSGPMRDIVATIQPEQDDLVRAPLRPALCVQGAPGTGKTAVGLHRIAYLLFTSREQLRQDGGVVIVGPNRAFLSYIRHVLPALGEVGVRQAVIEELIGAVEVRRQETDAAARVKGGARMAEVIARALWAQVEPLDETLVVQRGSRRWRIPPEELEQMVAEVKSRGTGYGSGPEVLARLIARAVMRRIEEAGESCDTRTESSLRANRSVKAAVQRMWPKADALRLILALLTDPEFLARAAEGLLTEDEQHAILLPGRPRGPKTARWSVHDLALIDEAAGLITRPDTIGHIVLDEAQDLTPMQCRAIARRCNRGSLTVLGDIAQGTGPCAASDWATLMDHLGQSDAALAELDRGFRVPAQIIAFAARLLGSIAPGLAAPRGVRRSQGALHFTRSTERDLPEAAVQACREALKGEGAVGLIAADAALPALHQRLSAEGLEPALLGETEDAMEAARLVCVPASLAKGLEFDGVVVAEPARIAAAEARGLHRLYVVLTRAVSTLHVVHAENLPEELAGHTATA
jgi:DNA helicase IV